jgi:AraC-like DNA-binding protein
MTYEEHAPWPVLAEVVACVWTLEGHAADCGGASQPVLPDGRPELILHLADAFERLEPEGRAVRQPRTLFAGQLLRQLTLRPTGRIRILGVRFHPHGAAAFLRVPQGDLAGLTIGVDDLSPPLAQALDRARDAGSSPADVATAVQQVLVSTMDPGRLDRRIAWATAMIQRRQGRLSVDRLASGAGLSRRHLERLFEDRVGLSPKRLARIARFQRALACLESSDTGAARGLTTAATCGYADQAHFIRDFRRWVGRPPGDYARRLWPAG